MFNYGFPKDWSTIKKLIWLKRFVAASPSWVWQLATGAAPLTLLDAVAHPIHSLKQYGLCVQDGTPTPDAPVDIVCNNGKIKVRRPSGMPIAYQMVEWLKPAGSIPITGFKTKSTQEIECVFYREQRGASYLYSSDTATSGTTNTTAYLTTGAGNWRWDGKSYSVSVSTGIKLTSIQNEDGVWLNGTKYGYYTDAGEFISTNDLRLSSGENATVRIYAMTIREGETVTLDLVPVQRVTDNAYGFYDKVSGNFYTNAEATFEAGDPIADPVGIYTDGTDEVLTVSGKNLFDENTVTLGYYYNDTGAYYQNSTSFVSAKIPIGAGVTVTFSRADVKRGVYMRISAFDSSDNWLALVGKSATASSLTATGTTPTNTAYIRVSASKSVSDVIDADCQVEIGSTASEYVPYVAPQTVTEIPMLLSVGDDTDELELISGHADRAITVFRVSPDMNWALASGSGYKQFYTSETQGQLKNSVSCMSNIAPYGCTASNRASYQFGCYTGGTGNLCFQMIGEASLSTVDAWKDFLRTNGVYVVAVKAEPTTEQTTPHALHTTAGTNVVDVSAAVGPVELAVEYAKEAS